MAGAVGARKMVGNRPITMAMATAHLNHLFFALCDRCGPERGVEWVGATVICDDHGWPLAGPPAGNGPALVVADCDLFRARDKALSERNDVLGDRRPELYVLDEPTQSQAELLDRNGG